MNSEAEFGWIIGSLAFIVPLTLLLIWIGTKIFKRNIWLSLIFGFIIGLFLDTKVIHIIGGLISCIIGFFIFRDKYKTSH
jgi:cell shape-determining protein MreD